MNYLEQIQYLCKKYKIIPKRNLGQNFLINEKIYQQIIKVAEITKDDLILEVGPGVGSLTTELVKDAKKVLSIELDKKFLPLLNKLAVLNKNLQIINEDILKIRNEKIVDYLNTKELAKGIYNYKIVANLPYNISSNFLRKFLSYPARPKLLVILLQKEIAERLTARPGEMSLLAVSCQFYAKPEIIEVVSKSFFWPPPEVDSAMVKLTAVNYYQKYKLPDNFNEAGFWQLIKIGFSAKRKKLKNNLMNGYQFSSEKIGKILEKLNIKETARAQELSIDKWLELFQLLLL